MHRMLAWLTMMSSIAMARGLVLRDWSQLPPQVIGHTVTLTTTQGIVLKGKLLDNKTGAFTIDVSTSSDVARFPRGHQVVPRDFVSEISGSNRKFSFTDFTGGAVVFPLNMAIHANGLFTMAIGWNGSEVPAALKAIDTLSIPFWLGWAGVGAAITPIITPIGYLRGSTHFAYTVR